MSAPAAVLDACVLAPLVMREALFAFARAGLFAPRWSARIEEEWARAALKESRGLPEALVKGDITLANAAFPDARVLDYEAIEAGLALPDWNDRHVLAAAIAAPAPLIVTDNVRDFPKRALAEHGVERIAADPFLADCASAPSARQALEALAAAAPPEAMRAGLPALLKRGRMPRFAKAAARAGF